MGVGGLKTMTTMMMPAAMTAVATVEEEGVAVAVLLIWSKTKEGFPSPALDARNYM